MGEKSADLEPFAPERMASRILGMGDVLSLLEKAEQAFDGEDAQRMARRLAKREFTLEDLQDQLLKLRRMGPLASLLELLPKAGPLRGLDAVAARRATLGVIQAILGSMTAAGAPPPRAPQRVAQAPHRARLRHHGAGHQPAPQAVPGDAPHDEGHQGQVAARRARRLSRPRHWSAARSGRLRRSHGRPPAAPRPAPGSRPF